MIDGYEVFHFVSVGLLFTTLIASFILAILAVIRLRIQRDPARRVFSWVKAAWLIFLISVVVFFTQLAMATIVSRWRTLARYGENLGYDLRQLVARIASVADIVSRFINVFVGIAVFLTLVNLRRCIDIAHLGTPGKVHKWPRRIAYLAATLMALLSLISLCMLLYLSTSGSLDLDGYNDYGYPDMNLVIVPTGTDLSAHSIQFIAALTLSIQSIIVKRRCRFAASLRKPTTFLVACAFLWLLTSAFDIYFDLFSNSVRTYFLTPIDAISTFNEVVRVVFWIWPTFIILVLLYVLGVHKDYSLRSIQQPPLMQEVESQLISPTIEPRTTREVMGQPVAAEAAHDPTAVQSATPMTETNSTEISVTTASHNPFPWDGLVDAPPQYTPAEAPRPTLPQTEGAFAGESTQQNPTSTQYRPTHIQPEHDTSRNLRDGIATSQPNDAAPGQGQGSPAAMSADPSSTAQSSHRNTDQPVSAISAEPPSHDEAMGLNHQVDGFSPRNEPLPYDKK